MQRIVVFDLAGVVCDYAPERRLAALAKATALSGADVERRVWDSGLDARADAGEFTYDEYAQELNRALDAALAPETYRKAWAASYPIRATVLSFVKSTPTPTAVFSNNGPMLSEAFAHELTPVADAVDHVVVSWQTGASKPTRSAYEGLGDIVQAAPSEMILVDDTRANVDGARAAGIDAILFRDVVHLRRELSLRHIVVNESRPGPVATLGV